MVNSYLHGFKIEKYLSLRLKAVSLNSKILNSEVESKKIPNGFNHSLQTLKKAVLGFPPRHKLNSLNYCNW